MSGVLCVRSAEKISSLAMPVRETSTLTAESKLLANTVLSVSVPRHIIGDIVNENT